jgi:hypothetical protein
VVLARSTPQGLGPAPAGGEQSREETAQCAHKSHLASGRRRVDAFGDLFEGAPFQQFENHNVALPLRKLPDRLAQR